ncbi:DUF6284 family protein [Kribbella sp. NPDC051718]|uniref:DUF6284 family protein n=1 Tax=Kribbella sp. NPDC051718 TaxID=3155168 RepID=UPI00343E02EC
MNIISLPAVEHDEPTPADLADIEREWPLLAAELDLLDAEISYNNAGSAVSELDRRRIRRAEYRVLTIARELAHRAPESEDVA